jgi:uncharacterized protein (DUF885 family)
MVRRAGRIVPILLVTLSGCAAGPGVKPPAPPASQAGERLPATPEAAALALADDYVAAFFARYPEAATLAGSPDADHAAVTDLRPEARRAWQDREDELHARASSLGGLAPGSPGWTAHAMVLEALEASIGMRACRTELWEVSAMGAFPEAALGGGWQDTYATLANIQPVGTPAARRAAIERLGRVPAQVDHAIANLREGLRLGYAASRGNVERVLATLDELLATAPGEWPYLDPARRDGAPELRAGLERVVAEALAPATRRYRDFLAGAYLPAARGAPGVGGLPRGAACYLAAIRAGTTTRETPERLHALGLEELARVRGELRLLAERRFGTGDVPALLARLRAAPEHRFASAQDVVARAEAALLRAERALPRAFSRGARCRPRVTPYAPAIAATGAPAMAAGSQAGACYQGVYLINTWEPTRQSRLAEATTTFHETLPGHLLDSAFKYDDHPGGPGAVRYLSGNAYSEGWATYAERLADELGLFETDLDRLGMLSQQAFRAARLVADTGLHAFGWSRERTAAFLAEVVGAEPAAYLAEVDRYSAWPGQALGYEVGLLEIGAARAEAERALGPGFDLARFHDVVLEAALPLPLLRERVRLWSAQEAARAGTPEAR